MSKYFIMFDMNTECLYENHQDNNQTNAYTDITLILKSHGFEKIQVGVYIGQEATSEVHCTLAIQEFTAKLDWFYSCVSNITLYRLESELDAQFIADRVHNAKTEFNSRISMLEQSLIASGMNDKQIKNILSSQQFAIR